MTLRELREARQVEVIPERPDLGEDSRDGQAGADPADGPSAGLRLSARRRSVWPFLFDLGLTMILFGLIITGRFLIVIGAVIFVTALTGWIRESRTDFSRLPD